MTEKQLIQQVKELEQFLVLRTLDLEYTAVPKGRGKVFYEEPIPRFSDRKNYEKYNKKKN